MVLLCSNLHFQTKMEKITQKQVLVRFIKYVITRKKGSAAAFF